MRHPRVLALAALLAGLLATAPAWGLSVQQVLDLRKAGVSDQLIQVMIAHEMERAAQGGQGGQSPYTVRMQGGSEVIVYHAGSAQAPADYTLDMDPAWRGSPGLSGLLGPGLGLQPSQPLPAAQERDTHPSRRYTLLLESLRDLEAAKRKAGELNAEGIEARVESVDLGGQGRWYRVLHGRFDHLEAAREQGEKLRQVGGIETYTVLAR